MKTYTNGKAYRILDIQKEIQKSEEKIKKDTCNVICMIILIPLCTLYIGMLGKFDFLKQCLYVFIK